ncbi:MAG: carboxypeptidase regulatory-like domain-containing protein [Gemmatimonadaceae bacterium]|nr:carboxypeptidase regulatory-like domain-containing protein [Gemmatimonadaceae bacterium]
MSLLQRLLRRPVGSFALGLLFTLVAPVLVGAQSIGPKPVGPNTITGVVTDTLGMPLADVELVIDALRRRARTRDDGSFRFDSIPIGTHALNARKLGYVASAYRVRVREDGGSVYIRMIRYTTVLPSMVTRATSIGVSGVIGDTAFRALPDVSVSILGGGKRVTTDSSGAFFVPLSPGRYMVRLEREGFARQTIGVTVDDTAGRRIAAWMVPAQGRANPLESVRLFDLNQRMIRANPVSSRFVTREDMLTQGIEEVAQLARRYAQGIVAPDCMVDVNGDPRNQIPLWQLSANMVEFVEIYFPSNVGDASARGVTSINGNRQTLSTSTSTTPRVSGPCGKLALIAWLRQ